MESVTTGIAEAQVWHHADFNRVTRDARTKIISDINGICSDPILGNQLT